MFIKQDCVTRSKKKFVEIDLKFLAYVDPGFAPGISVFCFVLMTQWTKSKMTKRSVNRMSKGRFDMIWTTAESATISENTGNMLMHYYIVRLLECCNIIVVFLRNFNTSFR